MAKLKSGTTIGGSTAWHAGNDGSGSGLDADLLDGLNSAQFLRSDADDTLSGDITHTGVVRNTNNINVDGPNFNVSTTNKTVNEYAYRVDRSGTVVGGITIDGRGILAAQSTMGGSRILTVADEGSGNGLDADTVDGLQASSFIRSDADDTFTGSLYNGSLNQTPSGGNGALQLQPSTSGGSTGIFFNSKVNANSDGAYIWWYDDNNNYRKSDSSENGALVIGIQNDGNQTSEDAIAIESSGDIFLNPGNDGGFVNAGGATGPDFAEGKVYIGRASTKYEVWHAGNDGSGSGLDADLLDGAQPSVSASNDTIVKRHPSGYIFANYFNTSPNDVSSGVTKVLVETGNDGYMRHGTQAAIRTFIGAGSGNGLDADLLDGWQLSEIVPYQSTSDFADGTLVTTSINAAVSSGESFVIEVTGKAYGASMPHSIIAEGYIYNNTIINTNGVNIGGSNFTYLKVMNNGGYLSFWWPRHGYWNSYSVVVRSSSAGTNSQNKVTSIANSVDPSGATKKIQIDLKKSWNSGNDGSGSGLDADTLDGIQGASFLRSDADDTMTGSLTVNDTLFVNPPGNNDDGVVISNGSQASLWIKTNDNNYLSTLFNSYGNIGLVSYTNDSNLSNQGGNSYIFYYDNGYPNANNAYTKFDVNAKEILKLTMSGANLNGNLVFEGATADANETTLTITDPTADRTITFPDASGTVITTGDTGTITAGMLASNSVTAAKIAAGAVGASEIANGSITSTEFSSVTTLLIKNSAGTTLKTMYSPGS